MNAHRILPFLERVWWSLRASQPSDRSIATMWYLTIADEKSYRRTFPLDSSIDLTGLLSLKVFNIDHICSSANLPKTIHRIYRRLHPKLLGPLAPRGKLRKPLRVFPAMQRNGSNADLRNVQCVWDSLCPTQLHAVQKTRRTPRRCGQVESASRGHLPPCPLHRLRNSRLTVRLRQPLGRVRTPQRQRRDQKGPQCPVLRAKLVFVRLMICTIEELDNGRRSAGKLQRVRRPDRSRRYNTYGKALDCHT
jgi:hypothetical protein